MQMHDFLSEVGLGTERTRLEGTQINVENESRKMHKDIFRSHFFFSKKVHLSNDSKNFFGALLIHQ